MAKVSLKNIAKIYDKKTKVMENVSLDIQDKEFIVLVGPSGCGKSTILRMIAGLEEISSGEISIGDRVVNDIHPKDRDIAMVFQNYALYPHMNIYDNMAFGLKMRKFSKEETDKRVKEAAENLGLTEYLYRKPKQLSGGQRQRVALGRAIVRNPAVFLMDEPLSNLDAKLRVQMRFEIKKLHERVGTTFIYVTHDQTEAMTMGDRIVILNEGKIQQQGTPEEIYNNPENIFVAGFIGSPGMNFFKASVEDGFINISGQKIPSPFAFDDNKMIVGIRPEHFSLEGDVMLEVDVNLVEKLGSEKIVHFKIDDQQGAAKLPYQADIKEDGKLRLAINVEKLHFFHIYTRQRYKFK